MSTSASFRHFQNLHPADSADVLPAFAEESSLLLDLETNAGWVKPGRVELGDELPPFARGHDQAHMILEETRIEAARQFGLLPILNGHEVILAGADHPRGMRRKPYVVGEFFSDKVLRHFQDFFDL